MITYDRATAIRIPRENGLVNFLAIYNAATTDVCTSRLLLR